MIEYDIYEKDDEYKAVRSEGFFCWQALLIGMIKIPFSTVIYPIYKGHRILALIALVLEISAFALLFIAKQYGSSEEQAISDIIKKTNKLSPPDAASGATA